MDFQCLLFRFLVATLFTSHVIHCRNSPPPVVKKTNVLDVSASIERTFEVLSFDPETTFQTLNEQEQGQEQDQDQEQDRDQSYASHSLSSSSSTSLNLKLHTRVSIHKSTHDDYRSLILSRLERDSARVKSLNLKLDLAVKGVNKFDLKRVRNETRLFRDEEIQSPVISGTSLGSGEYFSRIGIGNPARQVYMVLDTGSDVNWLQCEPCADCYQQSDPIYEPALSSSFSSLSCTSEKCNLLDVSECRNDTCLYEVAYGDGSFTVGDFITESITFSDSTSIDNVAIGCGHTNEGLFVAAAGLLGLGGGTLSLPSQINASSFSYCLVERDSNMASTLEFNSPLPPNAVTTSLLRNSQLQTFFYLGLTGLSVGGELLQIPESSFKIDETGDGGVIIDSGTAVTRLRADAYNSLRDAFVRGTSHLPSTDGMALFDTCYDLSTLDSVEIPTLIFHFPDDKTLSLPADNYLIPIDSDGTFCLAFAPTTSSLSIIGNVQQQGIRVGFDLRKSVIGFSSNDC